MKAQYLHELRTKSRILIKEGCVLMGGKLMIIANLQYSLVLKMM